MKIMSHYAYLLSGSLLMAVCVVGETPVYGQKIQEVHTESVDLGKRPVTEATPTLDLTLVEQQIFTGTNKFRTQEKRTTLNSNPKLAVAAKAFAEYLASTDKFSHTADGKEPWDRTAKAGYEHCIILENIAYEFDSDGFTAEGLADDCVQGWKNSPGHRRNMLDADVQDTGIGLARSSRTGRYYAVQDFGRPKSAIITFKVSDRLDTPVKFTIDGQASAANPGETITYERSRPPLLLFTWDEKAIVTEAERKRFRPINGASYIVRMREGNVITIESR